MLNRTDMLDWDGRRESVCVCSENYNISNARPRKKLSHRVAVACHDNYNNLCWYICKYMPCWCDQAVMDIQLSHLQNSWRLLVNRAQLSQTGWRLLWGVLMAACLVHYPAYYSYSVPWTLDMYIIGEFICTMDPILRFPARDISQPLSDIRNMNITARRAFGTPHPQRCNFYLLSGRGGSWTNCSLRCYLLRA